MKLPLLFINFNTINNIFVEIVIFRNLLDHN